MGRQQLAPHGVLGRIEHLRDPLVRGVGIVDGHHRARKDVGMLQRVPNERGIGEDPEPVPVGAADEGVFPPQRVDLLGMREDGPGRGLVEGEDRVRAFPRFGGHIGHLGLPGIQYTLFPQYDPPPKHVQAGPGRGLRPEVRDGLGPSAITARLPRLR